LKVLSWTARALAGMHRRWPARTPAIQAAAVLLFLSLSAPVHAQQAERLLPQSLNLQVVEGSMVPDDCMYPDSIRDTTRFETACVAMPNTISGEISAQYIGQLGQQGWVQGDYIPGGMTAVRTDENNCQRVLNLFPSDYPPSQENSEVVVLWFALDRTPRCSQAQPG
jgi:hypothetical protein